MTMLCRTERTRNGSYWRQLAAAVLVWVSVLRLTGCAAGGGLRRRSSDELCGAHSRLAAGPADLDAWADVIASKKGAP